MKVIMSVVGFTAVLAVMVVVAGCKQVETGALVTCQTEAAAVSVLADFRKAGKLSANQIALVNKDISIVDPVCSASTPQTALTGVVLAAASQLVDLSGSVK